MKVFWVYTVHRDSLKILSPRGAFWFNRKFSSPASAFCVYEFRTLLLDSLHVLCIFVRPASVEPPIFQDFKTVSVAMSYYCMLCPLST